jgi:hypothetical protein
VKIKKNTIKMTSEELLRFSTDNEGWKGVKEKGPFQNFGFHHQKLKI